MIQNFQLTIAAGSCATNTQGGEVLTIKTCTLPLSVAADGGSYQQAAAGAVLRFPGRKAGGFKTLVFQNPNVVAVTVSFYVGATAVQFSPSDNSAANAATYVVGNFGIMNNSGAANGLPACDNSGYLQITNNLQLQIAAADSTGHRRQMIVFSVDPNAAYPLAITDAAGARVMTLSKGQQIQLVCDSVFRVSGIGGTVGVTIGQVFLLNN